jgi:hypothetical protein
MGLLVFLPLATEILKAFNMAQANKPPDQVRAEAAFWWSVGKPILRMILSDAQKKELEASGVQL